MLIVVGGFHVLLHSFIHDGWLQNIGKAHRWIHMKHVVNKVSLRRNGPVGSTYVGRLEGHNSVVSP